MADQQRQQVQMLIRAGRYDEARAILQRMDHPKTAEWLHKLDALERKTQAEAPPQKPLRKLTPPPREVASQPMEARSEPDFIENLPEPDFVEDLPSLDAAPSADDAIKTALPLEDEPLHPRRLVEPRPSKILLSWYRLPRNWLRLRKWWAAILSALLLILPLPVSAALYIFSDHPALVDFEYRRGLMITLGFMGVFMPYYIAWIQAGGYRAYAQRGEKAMRRYPYLWPVHLIVLVGVAAGGSFGLTTVFQQMEQPIIYEGNFYTLEYSPEWRSIPTQDSPLRVCQTNHTCVLALRTFDPAADGLVFITIREYPVVPGTTAQSLADNEFAIQRTYVGFESVNQFVGQVDGRPASLFSYYFGLIDGGRGFEHVYYVVAYDRAVSVSFVMNDQNQLPFYKPEIDRFLSHIKFMPPSTE